MKAVAVRELKNRLSAYLREVASGEIVLVTDRGRVVAELRRPSVEGLASPAEQALGRLVAAGVLTLGLPQDPAAYQRTGVRIARPSQPLLDAERADRGRSTRRGARGSGGSWASPAARRFIASFATRQRWPAPG